MALLVVLVTAAAVAVAAAADGIEPPRFAAFTSDHFERRTRADPEELVPLVVGLHVGDFDTMERAFWSASDPTHESYGRFLAREDVDALSSPANGALDAVREWLGSSATSAGTFSPSSNLLTVPVKVKHVERLLRTELHVFEAREDGVRPLHRRQRLLRASAAISVPRHLHDVVSFLSINTHPLSLRALATTSSQVVASTAMTRSGGGTLASIRKAYDIPDDLVVTNASSTQCVPSFYDEAWSLSDLEAFFTEYLPGESPPFIIEKGDRQNTPDQASTEASLDVQYITGVARNATTYVWTKNGTNPYSVEDEPFVEFAQEILALDNPPLVVSISYSDDEEHIFDASAGYARTLDTLLIKMGLRGITVLVASGDDGVTGLRPEFEKIPKEDICDQSGPQWPSSSPYITTVGATMTLTTAHQPTKPFFQTDEEVVCSVENGGIITTGGGFSNIYAIPEYQRSAVDRYLKTARIPTQKGFFNASGRAYPDISALGAGYLVYMNGRLTSVSGTSASTPAVGAMVTLWNDARLNAGKSPLGFINPLIYYLAETLPGAFHDVVVGNNGAPRGNADICDDSFGATSGWDAVSGVGTPNFPIIAEFIAGLEDHFNASRLGADSSVPIDNSTNDATIPDSAADSSKIVGSSMSSLELALIVAAVVANLLIGVVVVVGAIKRWRNQYTPLGGPTSVPSAPRSTTASMTRVDRLNSDADASDDSDSVELSEINLRD